MLSVFIIPMGIYECIIIIFAFRTRNAVDNQRSCVSVWNHRFWLTWAAPLSVATKRACVIWK